MTVYVLLLLVRGMQHALFGCIVARQRAILLLIMWELQGWRFVRVNLIFYFFLSPVFLFINEMVSAVNVDLI